MSEEVKTENKATKEVNATSAVVAVSIGAVVTFAIVIGMILTDCFRNRDRHPGMWKKEVRAVERRICLNRDLAITPEYCDCLIEVAESDRMASLKDLGEYSETLTAAKLMERCPNAIADYYKAWDYLQNGNAYEESGK
jgi:hypothetical protein